MAPRNIKEDDIKKYKRRQHQKKAGTKRQIEKQRNKIQIQTKETEKPTLRYICTETQTPRDRQRSRHQETKKRHQTREKQRNRHQEIDREVD